MNYRNQTFSGEELRGEDIEDSHFIHCRFIAANLHFSSFKNCVFEETDLSGVVFDLTNFSKCSFPGSKLSNLDFSEVEMRDCDFSGGIFINCVFVKYQAGGKGEKKELKLTKAKFVNSDLSRTVFSFCDLSQANFQKANLTEVCFEKCNLTGADFTGALTAGSSFTDCGIENTKLDLAGFLQYGASKGFVLSET